MLYKFKMLHPLLINSQSDRLIQIINTMYTGT